MSDKLCPCCGSPIIYMTGVLHQCVNCNFGRKQDGGTNVGSIGKDLEVIRFNCTHGETGDPGYLYKLTGENKVRPIVVSVADVESGKHTEDEIRIMIAEASLAAEKG